MLATIRHGGAGHLEGEPVPGCMLPRDGVPAKVFDRNARLVAGGLNAHPNLCLLLGPEASLTPIERELGGWLPDRDSADLEHAAVVLYLDEPPTRSAAPTPSVRQLVRQVQVEGAPPDLPRRAAELVAAHFDAAAARSAAEKLGIRYVYATYCPVWLPSPHHRPLGVRFPSGATSLSP